VEPKNVAYPKDAKLLNRGRERLVRLARKHSVGGKARADQTATICPCEAVQACAHVLDNPKNYLGRVTRDIQPKSNILMRAALIEVSRCWPVNLPYEQIDLALAMRVTRRHWYG
jgi:hypothetical protein